MFKTVTHLPEQVLPMSPVYTTGGGWGVGEVARGMTAGTFPLTLTLVC